MAEDNITEIKTEDKNIDEIRAKAVEQLDSTIRTIAHGKMQLMTPIRSGGKDIDEIEYDFARLTSIDILDALDSDTKNRDAFNLTNRQAFALFAAAVEKARQGLDARDIKDRMGADDCITAIRVATAFFNASARRGALSIFEA